MPKTFRLTARFFFLLAIFGLLESHGVAAEKVGALGNITPTGGVVDLVAPTNGRIAVIHVKEGDTVAKGALLAVLEDNKLLEGELALAKLALEEARTIGTQSVALQELKVREVTELGKITIALHELKVQSAQEDYDFALQSFKRFNALGGENLSEAQMAMRKHTLAVTELNLKTVEKELIRLKQEQAIALSQAGKELEHQKNKYYLKVQRAENNLHLLKQKLDLSILKAPIKGTILEVFQHVGETTGIRPVLKIADLEDMSVIAEVFQGDLLKLSLGLRATITSSALPEPLVGKVETIGSLISDKSRTAKVGILLEDSLRASKLISLEVDISIEL